jgi:hypothetical protein
MAVFPTGTSTDADLYIGVNNLSTVLTDNPLSAGATTVNVSSTTGFPTVGILTIDLEAIHYTGTTATSFTGCTRGFDGTTGASHPLNTTVFHDIPAAHHNVLKDEIIAIETYLKDVLDETADGTVSLPAYSFATDTDSGLRRISADLLALTAGGIDVVQYSSTEHLPQLVTRHIDGTAAAPSYSFTSDSNTGILHNSADNLGISAGGVVRLSVTTGAVIGAVAFRGIDGNASGPSFSFQTDTDTGMLRNSADSLGFSAGGTLRLSISTSAITTASIPLHLIDGTAAAPSLSFGLDSDTGITRNSANNIGFTAGGTVRLSVSATGIVAGGVPIRAIDGTAGAPGFMFQSDQDTGIYNTAANSLGITAGGSVRLTASTTDVRVSNAAFRTIDGTAGSPAISFVSDQDTGITRNSANNIGFSAGGTVRMSVSSTAIVPGGVPIRAITGTAGAPSYEFQSDQDSGMYSAGADSVSIAAGGTRVFDVDGTTTGGATRLRIYDNDNAALERVTVGAADSGGAGFKVLRIPN